jgi:hypothetical protein
MTGSPVLAFLLSTSHRDRPSGVEDLCNVYVALSAWELACHTLPTMIFAAKRPFALSMSARYRPSQTVPSGTQRARRGCLFVPDNRYIALLDWGLLALPVIAWSQIYVTSGGTAYV